jgi:hypothetical protein
LRSSYAGAVAADFSNSILWQVVGSQYTFTFYYCPPYSYGKVFFDHLSTGSTSSSVTITLTGNTLLIAYYRTTLSATTTTATPTATAKSTLTTGAGVGVAALIGSVVIYFAAPVGIFPKLVVLQGGNTWHNRPNASKEIGRSEIAPRQTPRERFATLSRR